MLTIKLISPGTYVYLYLIQKSVSIVKLHYKKIDMNF
jgi:hypothetical protein